MDAEILKETRWRVGAVFSLCLLAIFFLSQLFPSLFLLWPFVFPFHRLAVRDATQHCHYILAPSVAVICDIALWSFGTVIFARFIGRMAVGVGVGYLVLFSLAAIALASFAIQILVWWLGMDYYLDLWH